MARADQRFKLLLTYDIDPEGQETYFQFMLGELVPAVQTLGLQMSGAWHTAYGRYPARLVEFVGDNHEAVEAVLGTLQWADLEQRLRGYVTNYRKRVVPVRDDQFKF